MKPFIPSNGTEFDGFRDKYCFKCTYSDSDGYCPITDRLIGFVDKLEEKPPEELIWRKNIPFCTKYQYDEIKDNMIVCSGCGLIFDKRKDRLVYESWETSNAISEGITFGYLCKDCLKRLRHKLPFIKEG